MTVKQAAQVLDLLQFFARRQRAASLAEIAQQLGWPRSSTFNMIGTLVDKGFLYEPVGRGGFYPTPRWLNLSQAVTQAQPVPEGLAEALRDAVAVTGETAVLAASASDSAVFLQVEDSPHAVRYAAHVGKRLPLYATATGRALLSMYAERERAALLARTRFERHTPATLSSARAVEADIAASLRRGWFESANGYTPDLCGIALPLVVDDRHYAMMVAGPISRVGGDYRRLALAAAAAVRRHAGRDVLRIEAPVANAGRGKASAAR